MQPKHLNLPLVEGRSTGDTPNTCALPPGHCLTASNAKSHRGVGSAHIWDSLASGWLSWGKRGRVIHLYLCQESKRTKSEEQKCACESSYLENVANDY